MNQGQGSLIAWFLETSQWSQRLGTWSLQSRVTHIVSDWDCAQRPKLISQWKFLTWIKAKSPCLNSEASYEWSQLLGTSKLYHSNPEGEIKYLWFRCCQKGKDSMKVSGLRQLRPKAPDHNPCTHKVQSTHLDGLNPFQSQATWRLCIRTQASGHMGFIVKGHCCLGYYIQYCLIIWSKPNVSWCMTSIHFLLLFLYRVTGNLDPRAKSRTLRTQGRGELEQGAITVNNWAHTFTHCREIRDVSRPTTHFWTGVGNLEYLKEVPKAKGEQANSANTAHRQEQGKHANH